MIKKGQKKQPLISSENLCDVIVKGMLEKKAENVEVLDLRHIQNSVADFFVIGTGNSVTQIDAIASAVEEEVFKSYESDPWRTEGKLNREWIIIDYVDVVAHVFNKDQREYYNLESLWGDAKQLKPTPPLRANKE